MFLGELRRTVVEIDDGNEEKKSLWLILDCLFGRREEKFDGEICDGFEVERSLKNEFVRMRIDLFEKEIVGGELFVDG